MNHQIEVLRSTRKNVGQLVGSLSEGELAAKVGACPEWSTHDLVAHLTGLAVDFCGDLSTVMAPGFWDHHEVDRREIEPRRAMTIAEVLQEWDDVTSAFETMLEGTDAFLAGAIVGDFVCHEHDLRESLDQSGARDSDAVAFSLDTYTVSLGMRVTAAGLGALNMADGHRHWLVGGHEEAASVRADSFELFRALTGRRTQDEVRAFEWAGDAGPYVAMFSMYDWPAAPLGE